MFCSTHTHEYWAGVVLILMIITSLEYSRVLTVLMITEALVRGRAQVQARVQAQAPGQ